MEDPQDHHAGAPAWLTRGGRASPRRASRARGGSGGRSGRVGRGARRPRGASRSSGREEAADPRPSARPCSRGASAVLRVPDTQPQSRGAWAEPCRSAGLTCRLGVSPSGGCFPATSFELLGPIRTTNSSKLAEHPLRATRFNRPVGGDSNPAGTKPRQRLAASLYHFAKLV